MGGDHKLRKFVLIAGFAESIVSFRGELICALIDSGFEVYVAAPGLKRDERVRRSIEDLGARVRDIPLRRTGTNPVADMLLAARIYALLTTIKPDAMLSYTVKPVIYGGLAGWVARVPRRYALITGLGYSFTDGRRGFLPAVVRFLYRFALARSQKVFFQNKDDMALFQESRIVSEDKPCVVVNGSGVDINVFSEEAVPKGPPTFLMISRLLGDKGVREYVRAAQRVRTLHPEARFGLAGWIDENPDAIGQDELEEWVGSGYIEFYGKLEDVRPSIKDCAVYVLPSYREGTPRTVLEAMAAGRPVITTDAPGCRETVVDGDNGFLVPVKSVDELVAAMTKFIKAPDLSRAMGRRSREIAEDKYDVHKVNAVMLREMGITPASVASGEAL